MGCKNSVLLQWGAFLGILAFHQHESDACGGKIDDKGEKGRVQGNKPRGAKPRDEVAKPKTELAHRDRFIKVVQATMFPK